MHTLFTKCTRLFFAALIMFLMVGMSTTAWGQTTESFNYSTGQLTAQGGGANVSGGVWVNNSGTTGTLLQVNAGNLTYTGYPTSVGNHLSTIAAATEDSYRAFPSTTGTLYVAFLLKVTSTTGLLANSSTTGDYFAGLIDTVTATNFVARFSIRLGSVANTFNLGMRHNSSNTTTSFNTTDLAINTTHLIVIKYEQPAGNTNNIASWFVDPTISATEPAAAGSQTSLMATDPVNIGRFFVREATNTTSADIDEIRWASSWASAVGATCPTITLNSLSNGTVNSSYSGSAAASGGTSPYTYAVTVGSLPAGLSLNASTGAVTGTPTVLSGSFSITATDANSCTGTQAYSLTFACPTITLGSLSGGQAGVAYSASVAASGGVGSYTYTVTAGSLPSGLSLNASTGAITGTTAFVGTASFSITATDANSCTGVQAYTPAFSCPTITLGSLSGGTVGTSYSGSAAASGGTGPYSYAVTSGTLPTGLSLNASSGAVTGTPTAAGNYTFQITATDANSCTGVGTYTSLAFTCPTITAGPATYNDGQNGVAYSGQATASGGTGPYTFAVTAGALPTGLSMSSSGAITGTVTAAGDFSFTVTATDANGCIGTVNNSIHIGTCAPFTFSPASLPNAGGVGAAYSQSISASNITGPATYAVTAGALPGGLNLASNGTLSGTVTGSAGTFSFSVTATDSIGCASTKNYSVVVCPVITLGSLSAGTVGNAYSGSVAASGGTGPYTYAVTSGSLPSGLSLNASTGAVTGTVTAATTGNFDITATDANGCTATQSYSVAFTCATITVGTPGPDSYQNHAYSHTYTANGGHAAYTFAVTSGTIPAGLSLSSGGALTGSPTTLGESIFTITATDIYGCTGSITDTVDVVSCPTISLSPASLPNGTQGVAYTQTLSSSGGTGPYTYAVTSGSLPTSITLNASSGVVSGTPTVPATYNFTVTSTDANGCTGSQAYTIIVNCPTITVNPASITGVNVGSALSATLTSTGGTASYSYAVTSGALPTGTSLSAGGVLSGTTTAGGTYNFTVTSTDANGCTGNRAYTVVIGSPAVFKVANVTGTGGSPDTLDWRSTATWQIVSGSSVSGFPKRRDIVILDNTNKLGSYVVTVGTSAADSVKQIIVGYTGNPNTITLLARANSNQSNPLTFGDSTAGNYDMDVQAGGIVAMERAAGRYNILGFSTAGDSVRIAPGGKFYHHSSGSLSGVLIGLSKDVSVAKGVFHVKLPKTIITPFNFSWAGGVYPSLILDGDSLVTYQGSTSLASAFGECVIAGDVTVMPNARWILGNSGGYEGTIWVKGNITNNGIIAFTNAAQNKIGMIGTSAQTIGGNAITLSGGLFVGNSAGVTLNTNVTSLGTVQTSGTLNYLTPQFPLNIVAWPAAGTLSTGSSTISINPNGSLTEGTNPILGKVSATRVVALSTLTTFGNIGYELNATGTAPDTTTIVRTTGSHLSGYLGHQSINRYYDITAKNGGSNSTIGVSYATSELNGLTESDLLIHRSSDLGTSWSGASGSVNTGTHKITASGVIGLTGRWTAAETGNPLFVSHNLLVKKVADSDGDINTTGDQVAARWRLSVYKDSLTGTLVATGNPPSGILAANALPAGNYVVQEADSTSAGWITLGNYHAGINAGSSQTVNVTLAGGVNDTVVFVNQKTASVSIAKIVSTDGTGSGTAHAWGLSLYKGSIAPANLISSVNASSLNAVGLQAGEYIAVEADSGASWNRINGNFHRFDTLTVTAASSVVDTFVNFQPNSIVITNYLDADGLFSTTGDRSAKAWHVELRTGSASGPVLISSETGSLNVPNLGDGTYYAVAADTALWTRLGYVLSGSPVASTSHAVAITVTAGQAGSVTFVQASPSYSVKYRTFLPNVLAVDVDNKGKAGKAVAPKTDKYIFSFSMVPPDTGINGVHIELGAGVDTNRAWTIDGASVKSSTDGKLMKWDITFSDTVSSKDTIGFMGFSVKKNKLSKYSWLKNGVNINPTGKQTSNKTIVVTLEGKLPMPNRINALNAALASGVTIGVPRTDSLKQYGWIQNAKAADVLKSLVEKGTFHTGSPAGFGNLTSGKQVQKANKSLPPSKMNDVLIADLIALKLNIAASAMSITPNGFGELLYNDGTSNPFNGKMVKEIAALADTFMMGRYDTNHVHVFADSSVLNALHTTAAAINGGFEGAIDTMSFGSGLVFKGTQLLKDVTFLHANPSVAPAKITPAQAAASVEPEVYALYQNYPNPFNPTTNIRFDLPLTSVVTLKIYNILGQEVATLLNHEQYESGVQEVTFNASRLASGVYFYRLEASSVASEDNDVVGQVFTKVSKMLLIK